VAPAVTHWAPRSFDGHSVMAARSTLLIVEPLALCQTIASCVACRGLL
jgi:hypothetical protein